MVSFFFLFDEPFFILERRYHFMFVFLERFSLLELVSRCRTLFPLLLSYTLSIHLFMSFTKGGGRGWGKRKEARRRGGK